MTVQVFISYRSRTDAAAAGRLAAVLGAFLGEGAVFLDNVDIPPGAEWPRTLEAALNDAMVLLAVIGPGWLDACDDDGRPLLQRDKDWVRDEIAAGLLDPDTTVIPVLVGGAEVPSVDDLPLELHALHYVQAFPLAAGSATDVGKLADHLAAILRARGGAGWTALYPTITKDLPDPLTPDELDALAADLPSWQLVRSIRFDDPGGVGTERSALTRTLRFANFAEAIDFMAELAPACDRLEHHPRWENVYRTIKIHLTTFDIGERVTARDAELARVLEEKYITFCGGGRCDSTML